jgi:pyridoxine 5-phosphate synthase
MKLGINIDHIATLRNARAGDEPDVIQGMKQAINAGCDSIVCHLRIDRRHIMDDDVYKIRELCTVPMNLEASLEPGIIDISLDIVPDIITIVPERREELTTEGGLDVISNLDRLKSVIPALKEKGITVSLFIGPDEKIIDATCESGATSIELHTGCYANTQTKHEQEKELDKIIKASEYAFKKDLFVAAGHGLNYENTASIAGIKTIQELNIGHSVISKSIFTGLESAVKQMKQIIDKYSI